MDQERRTAVPNQQRLAPEDIATRAFSSSFRGLSESEVRAYLKRISDEMVAAHTREQELRGELAAAVERAAHREPLDESELLEALGEETAKLLRSAREAARDIRSKAEESAAAVRSEAQVESERVLADATEQLAARTAEAELAKAAILDAADADAARIRSEADADAQAKRDAAAAEATSVIDAAKAQGRSMVEEAKSLRERIVADLGHRRGLLQSQIAELRAGREHLLDAYRVVKQTFLEATDALSQVEKKASISKPLPIDPADIAAIVDGDTDAEEVADDLSQEVVVTTDEVEAIPEPETSVDSDVADIVETDVAEIVESAVAPAEEPVTESSEDLAEAPRVEDLFARIRAQAEPIESEPNESNEVDAPSALASTAGDAVEPEPNSADDTAVMADDPISAAAADADAASDADAEAPPATGSDDDAPVSPAAAMMQTVAALVPVAAKRAKRASQDEQNEVLDGLRRHKGRLSSAAILSAESAHAASWLEVLRPMIDTSYANGRAAVSGEVAADGLDRCPDDLATEVVTAVVGGLRERIAVAIDSGDAEGATDRVNARFREWKSQQLDDLLIDALIGAFVGGRFDASPSGSMLQWVVAEAGCCADCADNSLESVLKGAEFPTGHALPPAHPGCRCALASG